MNKFKLLVTPLLVIPFIVACNNGGGDKPEPSEYMLSITLDNCKIEEESTTYSKKYAKGATIDAINVTPIGDCLLGNNSVPTEYKDYWKESTTPGTWTFSGLTMNEDHKFTISATGPVTLTIELNNCKIGESTTYTKVYAKGATINPVMVTPDDGLSLTSDSVSKEYQQYWSNNDGWKLHDLVMKQSYAITISAGYVLINETPGVTIYPNVIVPNQEYEGRIFINDESIDSKILPLSLDSVLISDTTNANIADSCTYEVKDNNKDSYFEIPAEYTITNIRVNLTTKDIAAARWKDYANWWDYCSNEIEGIEAKDTDVGSIVNVTVYGIVHEVRLIDVDHIGIRGETNCHCTFEFKEVIADSYYEIEGMIFKKAISTNWNNKDDEDNYDFPYSTLNDLLNNDENCIFKALPVGLQEKIRTVTKMVACGESYTVAPYQTKLFPLAHDEIVGQVDGAPAANEGTIYKYYDGLIPDLSEQYPTYWLRSPDTSYYRNVWQSINDEQTYIVASGINTVENRGVAPAFCI